MNGMDPSWNAEQTAKLGGYKFVPTSNTAQGGGGSFQIRKTIGEVVGNDGWQRESTGGLQGG